MLLVRRSKLAVEPPDLGPSVFEIPAQFFLVAFLEHGRDFAIDLIDSFVEGSELLFGVLQIGDQFLPVLFHGFESGGDLCQLAARADALCLLVGFYRGLPNMLDRVVDHPQPEERANGALHALALRGQGHIRFDEAQRNGRRQ